MHVNKRKLTGNLQFGFSTNDDALWRGRSHALVIALIRPLMSQVLNGFNNKRPILQFVPVLKCKIKSTYQVQLLPTNSQLSLTNLKCNIQSAIYNIKYSHHSHRHCHHHEWSCQHSPSTILTPKYKKYELLL